MTAVRTVLALVICAALLSTLGADRAAAALDGLACDAITDDDPGRFFYRDLYLVRGGSCGVSGGSYSGSFPQAFPNAKAIRISFNIVTNTDPTGVVLQYGDPTTGITDVFVDNVAYNMNALLLPSTLSESFEYAVKFKFNNATYGFTLKRGKGSKTIGAFTLTAFPVVTAPANITVATTSKDGAVVPFTLTDATDLKDGVIAPTADWASGSTFPIATTTVTVSATDSDDNTGTATFTVTVNGAPEITVLLESGAEVRDGGEDLQGDQAAGTAKEVTYTVKNTGIAELKVRNITTSNPRNVTVASITSTSFKVPAGGTVDFEVTYTPAAAGAFSFDLDISNTDANENPYDIKVEGTGTGAPEPPGYTVSATSLTIGENARTDTYTVVLDAQPDSDVVIDVSSSDTGEATVSPASLTFTNGNWATPRTVTVTGVDDAVVADHSVTITNSINDAKSDDALIHWTTKW